MRRDLRASQSILQRVQTRSQLRPPGRLQNSHGDRIDVEGGRRIQTITKDGDYEDIEFYNPLPAPYCESVTEGAANGIKQITAYNERCPDAKLVVSGYSQGGQVVGDVLGGGG